jgi:hypothetical protein
LQTLARPEAETTIDTLRPVSAFNVRHPALKPDLVVWRENPLLS